MKGKSDFWWAYKASNVDSKWKKARVRGVFVVFWGFVDFDLIFDFPFYSITIFPLASPIAHLMKRGPYNQWKATGEPPPTRTAERIRQRGREEIQEREASAQSPPPDAEAEKSESEVWSEEEWSEEDE